MLEKSGKFSTKDMAKILRARKPVVDVRMQGFHDNSECLAASARKRHKEPTTVWDPKVSFCVKRCGYVAVSDTTASQQGDDIVTEGKGSAMLISREQSVGETMTYMINHPIVLVKQYKVALKQHLFDKQRLESSIERLLQYSGHDVTITEELTDLVILLLSIQGIHEPFLLDIRMMLAKVLQQTIL